MLLKLKLKGGALYIALIISIVIGIILSVFILIAYFNQRQVLSRLALTQLRFNLKSGLSMAASANFSDQINNTWQALSNINEDSIRVKKLQWGSYEVISVETKNRMHYLKEAAVYGVQAGTDTAIVLADRSRPIGLSGKIKFNGACYFPKAGYKSAYIEGQSFNSDGSINSYIRPAPAQVPSVKDQLIAGLKKCITGINPNTDSLITVLPENLAVAFSGKTALLQTGKLSLSNHILFGNIKVVADEVLVKKDCSLNNILIVAGKVRVEPGFKGNLHILAKDSIIAGDGCIFDYPSSLTIFNDGSSGTSMKGIYLGKACIVNGAMVALGVDVNASVIVKLNMDCEVYGLIYSENYAHIQGKIFGTVICETLLFTTPSAVYENTMLSCELDPKKFGHSLVIPSLFKTTDPYKCCKWL